VLLVLIVKLDVSRSDEKSALNQLFALSTLYCRLAKVQYSFEVGLSLRIEFDGKTRKIKRIAQYFRAFS
jgi:hypothetical protein